MANIKSAIKRAELNVKQNEKNSAQKSALRTVIKAFKANPTEEAFRAASASIDKAASKGLIHKNKASRDKSRLAAKLANQSKTPVGVFSCQKNIIKILLTIWALCQL